MKIRSTFAGAALLAVLFVSGCSSTPDGVVTSIDASESVASTSGASSQTMPEGSSAAGEADDSVVGEDITPNEVTGEGMSPELNLGSNNPEWDLLPERLEKHVVRDAQGGIAGYLDIESLPIGEQYRLTQKEWFDNTSLDYAARNATDRDKARAVAYAMALAHFGRASRSLWTDRGASASTIRSGLTDGGDTAWITPQAMDKLVRILTTPSNPGYEQARSWFMVGQCVRLGPSCWRDAYLLDASVSGNRVSAAWEREVAGSDPVVSEGVFTVRPGRDAFKERPWVITDVEFGGAR